MEFQAMNLGDFANLVSVFYGQTFSTRTVETAGNIRVRGKKKHVLHIFTSRRPDPPKCTFCATHLTCVFSKQMSLVVG
jgi:hypothetical protein